MAARTNSTTYERVLAVHNFGVSGEQSFNFELVAKAKTLAQLLLFLVIGPIVS